MFEWFRKRKSKTLLGQIGQAMYGDSPPTEPPDLEEAIRLAHTELLHSLIGESEVRSIATELRNGPMPYTTHSLAVSAALNFFRRPDRVSVLQDAQLMARMTALKWAQKKLIPPVLLATFEESLYTRYRPGQ